MRMHVWNLLSFQIIFVIFEEKQISAISLLEFYRLFLTYHLNNKQKNHRNLYLIILRIENEIYTTNLTLLTF